MQIKTVKINQQLVRFNLVLTKEINKFLVCINRSLVSTNHFLVSVNRVLTK